MHPDDTAAVAATALAFLTQLRDAQYEALLPHCSDLLISRLRYLGDPSVLKTPGPAAEALLQWQSDTSFTQLRQLSRENPITLLPGFPLFQRADPVTLLAVAGFVQTGPTVAAVVLLREPTGWTYHNLQEFDPDPRSPGVDWWPSVEAAEAGGNATDNPNEEDDDDDDYWGQYDNKTTNPGAPARTASSSALSTGPEDSYWSQYDAPSPAPNAPAPDTVIPARVITSGLAFNQEAVSPVELFNRLKTLSESEGEDETADHTLAAAQVTRNLPPAELAIPPVAGGEVADMSDGPSQGSPPDHQTTVRDALRAMHAMARSLGVSSAAFVDLAREAAGES
ncbi:hypothetical protein IWQ60_011032 [Tieghemiomyces parasiticus]|uniref:Uncharacterized protein n=1 Tax=Tieghemiomyces parasiticus TaxID=78921 RepID=A0A9W7ZI59_9FUNG|nr:hypothetical protein IWQ60_011032 [Tieghemiomyces parasiticus]